MLEIQSFQQKNLEHAKTVSNQVMKLISLKPVGPISFQKGQCRGRKNLRDSAGPEIKQIYNFTNLANQRT